MVSVVLVKWKTTLLSRLPLPVGRVVSLILIVCPVRFGGILSGYSGVPSGFPGRVRFTGQNSGVGAGGVGFSGKAGSRTQNWPLFRSPGSRANGRMPAPSGVPTRPDADLVSVAESVPI